MDCVGSDTKENLSGRATFQGKLQKGFGRGIAVVDNGANEWCRLNRKGLRDHSS